MIETNRIEFKRELTKDLDIEKEDIFGESLGSGMASVMKSYSPANFTFFPHFVRFSVEYINHAILSRESKTSESAPLNAESGRINETESLLLELINRHKGVNRTSLIALAHISERTANRWLSSLTQKHLIERRGSKKTGGYWLVDSTHKENS